MHTNCTDKIKVKVRTTFCCHYFLFVIRQILNISVSKSKLHQQPTDNLIMLLYTAYGERVQANVGCLTAPTLARSSVYAGLPNTADFKLSVRYLTMCLKHGSTVDGPPTLLFSGLTGFLNPGPQWRQLGLQAEFEIRLACLEGLGHILLSCHDLT